MDLADSAAQQAVDRYRRHITGEHGETPWRRRGGTAGAQLRTRIRRVNCAVSATGAARNILKGHLIPLVGSTCQRSGANVKKDELSFCVLLFWEVGK